MSDVMWSFPFAAPPTKYPCDCCSHKTLDKPGEFEICPVCWWEEDPVQKDNEYYVGGAANDVSLYQARANYREFGAAKKNRVKHVRPPTDAEKA